jgi:transcriptional regulator with XRE-family HTH domain
MPSNRLASTLECIAANVRTHRRQRNLTQDELSKRADLDLRFVQRVERARTNLSVAVLLALADALKVDPTVLFKKAKMEPSKPGRPKKK